MNTPIVDFVKNYSKSGISRMHMPGHKGRAFLGFEQYDITEIDGADVLSSADGIIKESEDNATSLFKTAHSFYSAGGSTLSIYAMVSMVCRGKKNPLIIAARNVHKAFVHACALVDCDVLWLFSESFVNLCSCKISAKSVDTAIRSAKKSPVAVYLTSPDYLGQIQDIFAISAVCEKYDIPLIVDNAHGAYLAFLNKSLHPIALGAAVCCDSAHKTLPALTGAGYLHVSESAPKRFLDNARDELALFYSTSPSYLILQSLDYLNSYLCKKFKNDLADCINKIDNLKTIIKNNGISLLDGEPLKIVINAQKSGYSGFELSAMLRQNGIEAEFCDRDFLVLMLTPQNTDEDFKKLEGVFSKLSKKTPVNDFEIDIPTAPKTKMSIRNAVFAESEIVCAENSIGRICAAPTVSCPPAVPVVVSGEEITPNVANLLKYYGIDKIKVVKNK